MAGTTPIYTQEQYDSLVAALAEGVKQVQYSDKMVTYRSLDEMLRLKLEMEKALCIGDFAPGVNTAQGRFYGRNVGSYCSGK